MLVTLELRTRLLVVKMPVPKYPGLNCLAAEPEAVTCPSCPAPPRVPAVQVMGLRRWTLLMMFVPAFKAVGPVKVELVPDMRKTPVPALVRLPPPALSEIRLAMRLV